MKVKEEFACEFLNEASWDHPTHLRDAYLEGFEKAKEMAVETLLQAAQDARDLNSHVTVVWLLNAKEKVKTIGEAECGEKK